MQIITIIIIVVLSCITISSAQNSALKLPNNSLTRIQKRKLKRTTSSASGRNDETEQIRNKKLQIASMVDMENVKFGLQLKAASERRQKVFRKWSQTELLNQINKRTREILNLKNVTEALSEFMALGATPQAAVAAIAEHMDFEHMENTVKHALDPDYPMGKLPYWKTTVAKQAEAEAVKLIKNLVHKLQATL